MNKKKLFLILIFAGFLFYQGCSSSKSEEEVEEIKEVKIKETETLAEKEANKIILTARAEQENEMYSPEVDSTYLYWLDSSLTILNGSTKCNIFALNVLKVAGFKTPEENAICRDLFDTSLFRDILPVININDLEGAYKGDLIIWSYHVIIFESEVILDEELYAKGWWAGTRQEDNGDNIINNVCHGKYKINGEFVVRRPVKRL